MNRRAFLGIAAASVFAPKFGRWYRQGSGLIVRDLQVAQPYGIRGAAPYYTQTLTVTGKHGNMLTVAEPIRQDLLARPHSLIVVNGTDFRPGMTLQVVGR